MRKLLFSILILSSLYAAAQTKFLPHKNTEWHYLFGSYYNAPQNFNDNETLKYVRDSILGNDTVKVVAHTRYYTSINGLSNKLTLFKQKNDSVFFRNAVTFDQWQLLINYGATPGQKWNFTIKNLDNSPQTYTVTVTTVTTAVVNGMPLKLLKVFYSGQYSTGNADVYERFGDIRFLFNFADKNAGVISGDASNGILCYQDSTFGLKQFSNKPCDYTVNLRDNAINAVYEEIAFYPNPTNGVLHLKTSDEHEIKLISILGHEVFIIRNKDEIDISHLANGIYFLQVYNKGTLIQTNKIIKK